MTCKQFKGILHDLQTISTKAPERLLQSGAHDLTVLHHTDLMNADRSAEMDCIRMYKLEASISFTDQTPRKGSHWFYYI